MAMTAFSKDNPHLQAGGGRLPRNLFLYVFLSLLGVGVMLLGASITGGLGVGLLAGVIASAAGLDTAQVVTLSTALYLVFVFGLIYAFAWLWLRFVEGRSFRTIGFVPRRGALRFLAGFGAGVGSLALTVVLMAAFGVIQEDTARDPGTVGMAALVTALLIAGAWCIQGTAEEVLTRGYLLQNLGKRTPLVIAVVVQAAFFAILHLSNAGVTLLSVVNLVLVGVFLAFWALWEGGIWGVSGWHAAWNWTQGNVFGFPVSGSEPPGGSLVALQSSGPELLAGGPFGPEGSIATTIVLALLAIFFLVLGRRGMQSA